MNKVIYKDMEKICEKHINCFSQLKDKSILLIGSTGNILSYMSEFLVALNLKYELGIKLYLHGRNLKNLKEKHSNILDKKDVFLINFDLIKEIPKKIHFDYIIHGASPAATKFFLETPVDTILPNVYGMKNVLDYARENISTKVIFLSSVAIYGNVGVHEIRENDYGYINPLLERSSYSESKRLTEQLCVAYHRQYNVNVNIARIPYTYGLMYDLKNDNRALPRFIKQILKNKDIDVFEDEALLQYTYVADVVSGLIYILLNGKPLPDGVYNISAKEQVNMYDMLKIMIEAIDTKSKIILKKDDYYFKNNKEINFSKINSDKLKSLGWKQMYDINTGLRQMMLGINENIKEKINEL